MATQEERRRDTRHRIVASARELFARQGIEATSTEAVLQAAGVSRGALYHHFASREDLIAVVYEEEAAGAIARAVQRVPSDGSVFDGLVAGCLAWLDEARRPEVARILLEGGPAVLGWQRWWAIEERYSLNAVAAELRRGAQAGELRPVPVEVGARMVNAVLGEAVLTTISSQDPERTRADCEAVLRTLLSGLLIGGGTG